MTKLLEYVGLYSFGFTLMGAHTIGVPSTLGVASFWIGVTTLFLTTGLLAWREAPSHLARWRRPKVVAPVTLPEFVPLYEVALQAYEDANGRIAAEFARFTMNGSVLTWYAYFWMDRIQFYGMEPPSRVREPVRVSGFAQFDFEQILDTIIIKERYGDRRWEQIALKREDVPGALAAVREYDRPKPNA